MKKKALILVCAGILVAPILAQANPGWTDFSAVGELVPTARHYYEVRLPVRENPSGCKNKTWFYQDYGSRGSDKMFQTLLEAVKAEKQVRVYVTDNCNIDGYSEISSVSIIP